jgi:16S rRNA (guanine(1405)-N(7))-methyltransferase
MGERRSVALSGDAQQPDAAVVESVVQAVLASPKYAALDPALVASLAEQELRKGRRVKEAIKEVKNRLHQSAASYWQAPPRYARWRTAIEAAEDEPALKAQLQSILRTHHSMRERLPFLVDFYRTLFAGLSPLRSVLDLGCGVNPLALPWMGLPTETAYFACDIDREQMAFLDWWLAQRGRRGRAFVWNLLAGAPPVELVDAALLLKMAPCLAQLDPAAPARLLDEVRASVWVVSFPARSLGGRDKGMVAHYAAMMDALLTGRNWRVERFDFPTELVFRVHRETR